MVMQTMGREPILEPPPASASSDRSSAAALCVRGVSKRFAGVTVLDDVTLDIRAGEIHTVIGENGAGKSTLMKILAGVHRPDAGDVLLDGKRVDFRSPRDAMSAGVVLIHQEPLGFPDLTVAENVLIARGLPRGAVGQIDWRAAKSEAIDLLSSLGVTSIDPMRKLAGLSIADQQMVELAAALSQDAKVLLMDEPTAALTPREADRLFALAERLKRDGVAIVFISHRLPEVFAVSDRITVLRDGKLVGTRATVETSHDEVIRMMVGRELGAFYERGSSTIGDELLRVENLSSRGRFEKVSFTIRAGEIVGLAGLVGAGRTEVAETIFGVRPRTAGEVRVNGSPVDIRSPAEALRHGVAYVPEDRARHGLLLPLSIAWNTTLATLRNISAAGLVSRAGERREAERWKEKLATRLRDVDQPAGELSGGNQQKVVLSKWLATSPRVLIVDEPTRGIDVGAKAEVHHLLAELARQGHAILMISSDLPEVLAMSDRVLVMRAGKLVAELPRAEATQEAVMAMATGTGTQREGEAPAEPADARSNVAESRIRIGSAGASPSRHLREAGIAIVLVALVGIVALIEPRFASADTLRSIALYVPLLLIMAIGQLMVMAARHIDLSVGSTLGLSAIVAGGLFVSHPGTPWPVAMLVAVLVGAVAGLANGALVAYLRVPAIIATLGTMTAYRGLVYMWSGGEQVDPDKLPASLIQLAQSGPLGLPWLGWIALLVAIAGGLFMRYAASGRAIYAIGSNPRAAELRGIPVRRVTLMVFAISGALAGLAGILFGARYGTINPASAGNGDELRVISAVVIGGASVNGGSGNAFGTLLGCLLLGVIAMALPALRIAEFWQLAVYGVAIIAAASLDGLLRRARFGGGGVR
jgi:ABC-type sugar transport system ATPase subunit/ribose/xylose/arabinose/galactoside ABC-type transport system permease subunit